MTLTKKLSLLEKTLASITVSVLTLLPMPSFASVIGYFDTEYNTDWTFAGYGGMRGIGSGSIEINGISGSVNKAYLYWHGPTNSNDPNVNANVIFNGNNILGNNIGFSDDNFWGFTNSQAYRADVTSFVSGNGFYSLSNLRKPNAEINGVSLLVFFDDGNSSNNRDVVLFDGNDANFANPFDPVGWNVSLSGIQYTSGSATLVTGVSDGQNFGTNDDGNLTVNGTIIASGGIFQGNSVPKGPGGPSNGGLWDIKSFDITSFLTPGPNTLNISLSPVQDALSLVHLAIDLPAGAAPPPPPESIPEPSTLLSVLTFGTLGGYSFRKGRKQKLKAQA
ncbi:PEP-CTERM sorting domain-containing protein [Nostoc sp. NIES-2111]